MADDLTSLRDDMTAFIEGHGLRRFHGFVGEEVQTVLWDAEDEFESWKDYVELAKASGATFLTVHEGALESGDVDSLVERLRRAPGSDPDDMDEARWLRTWVGKTGFVQLGWPWQGTVFLYEVSTPWYERYQRLLDLADEFDPTTIEGPGSDLDEER
ncbi:MAG: hypothetical protein ACRD2R_00910 [Terriglobales bacterium]